MKEQYRALDELEQHCLFIYLFTNEKDEAEIVDSMFWHLEDAMMERVQDLINKDTGALRMSADYSGDGTNTSS